jgi:hypothetical protein
LAIAEERLQFYVATVAVLLALDSVFARHAFAYLDPGVGSIYMQAVLGGAIAGTYFLTAKFRELRASVGRAWDWWLARRRIGLKFIVAVALVAGVLAADMAMGVNPGDYAFLPLLAPVVLCAAVGGIGPGLLSVALNGLVSAYYFAEPSDSFAMADWRDALALTAFLVIGSLVTLAIHRLVPASR